LVIPNEQRATSNAECSIWHQQVQGNWVALSVADTGCGIDPEVLDKIFDPFFSTNDAGKGNGLSLAVVLGILRRSGGHILLESEPGKGTTFQLLFPASLEPVQASQEAGEYPATPRIGKGEQILVLDDQPGLAKVLGEMLITHGYRSTAMTDSRDALTLIKENPDMFALVLTDQTMPDLTGVELVQFLQEIRPGLPVILTAGFSPYVDAATAASMNIEFLQKPVQPGILIQTVARLLSAAAVNADRNPPPPPPTADAPDR